MMERNLLTERFKLVAHFSKAEMVAYEMTVAKGGPKFKAVPSTPKPGKAGQDWGFQGFGGGRAAIRGGRPTMDQLASFLSYFTDWPVVNATGLEGRYDITVEFGAAEPWLPGNLGSISGVPRGPDIPDALRDQLGLVLERTKSVVDVLVVDHAEKTPTKN
jgi:uncharacterized protein (TIGR03435 family)